MKQKVNIILASGSPRRKELLNQVGLTFTVLVTDADETIDINEPEKVVEELSRRKCIAAAEEFLKNPSAYPSKVESAIGTLIVAADTVVALENAILGKPVDENDALRILMSLSGKTHYVYTGVSYMLIRDGERGSINVFTEKTAVTMYDFDEKEALDYISTGEPHDKAGAYGIQGIGARLVKSIEGDYNNVVGFPLAGFIRRGMGEYYE